MSLIANLLANGMSTEQIIRENPNLEPEDIRQALSCASVFANEEIHLFKSPAARASWPTQASR